MEDTFYGRTVLAVLLFSSLAAGAAALGALPFLRRTGVPVRWIGWAYAFASGLMLGASYILMTEGLRLSIWPVILGGVVGVATTYGVQRYTGTTDLATEQDASIGPEHVVKFVLLGTLHSASEGVAIGVAALVRLELGIFLALSLAVHNVAEATVLTAQLRRVGTTLRHSAALAVITNVSTVLMAIVAFAVIPAIPGMLTWMLGVTAGALVFLTMTELMPYAYERAGRNGIALLVSVAAGGVVLLRDIFVRS